MNRKLFLNGFKTLVKYLGLSHNNIHGNDSSGDLWVINPDFCEGDEPVRIIATRTKIILSKEISELVTEVLLDTKLSAGQIVFVEQDNKFWRIQMALPSNNRYTMTCLS